VEKSNKLLNATGLYNYKQFDYIQEISISNIKRVLRDDDLGELVSIYKTMLGRDLHIASELSKRKLQIISIPTQITSSKKDSKEQKFIQAYFDTIKLNDIILNIASAVGYGFCVYDLVWGNKVIDNQTHFVPVKYNFINQYHFDIDLETEQLYIFSAKDNDRLDINIDDPKFLTHFHKNDTGSITDYGVLKKLIWSFTQKAFVISHYMKHTELLGVPPVIVKASSDEKKELDLMVEQVLSLRSAGVAAFPKDTQVDMLNNKASDNFLPFIKYIDQKISQQIIGSTLTSNNDGGGSYSLGKTHNEIRQTYLKADCYLIEETINELIKKICDFNFVNPIYPKFQFIHEDNNKQPENQTNTKKPNQFNNSIELNSQQIKPKDHIDKTISKLDLNSIQTAFKDDLNSIFENCTSFEDALQTIADKYKDIDFNTLEQMLVNSLFATKVSAI
jgi:phage gp29-like protein